MEGLLFQTSLIAAFIAGMVALFAPCCITFLLPAYLGNVFKEKEKVLLMTLIFGLGIFVVLLPAVLGIAFVSHLLFRYHNTIYLIAALVMLAVAFISLLGIKMPMPHINQPNSQKPDVLSVFTLGIFSGLTSACCAPVLIGLLSLTFLSPNFLGAIFMGAVYVLGMVTPLLLISLFLENRIPKFTILRKPFAVIVLGGKQFPVILSNLIAAVIFFITGTLTLFLTLSNRLSMEKMNDIAKAIQNLEGNLNNFFGNGLILNVIFLLIVIYFLYWLTKKI